jgi:hypothetical protein
LEGEYRYSSTLPLTSVINVGGWSLPRPGRFTPEKVPEPVIKETGWDTGLVWNGCGKCRTHRDSIHGPSSSHRVTILTELADVMEKVKVPLTDQKAQRG